MVRFSLVCILSLTLRLAAQSPSPAHPASSVTPEEQFCFDHPVPSARCLGPGVPAPPPYSVPTRPLPDPPQVNPSPSAQEIVDRYKADSEKAARESNEKLQPIPTAPAPPVVVSPPPQVSQPAATHPGTTCYGSQCGNSGYQSGYVLGNALGNAMMAGIERHRIKNACKKNPYGAWRFANGATMSCGSFNAGRPVIYHP
jgi:hypothetical protein